MQQLTGDSGVNPAILHASRIQNGRGAVVAIPTTRAQPSESIQVVEENGVVRKIKLRCDCGCEHVIELDYQ